MANRVNTLSRDITEIDDRLTLRCRFGDASGFIPASLVLDIGLATPAAPLPFASAVCEGVVAVNGNLVTQFDPGLAFGGGARTGRFAVLIRTSRGPARFRADALALHQNDAGEAPSSLAPSSLDQIEALVADCVPAESGLQCFPALPPAYPPASLTTVLIVRSGTETVALPSTAVERVHPLEGLRPARCGAPEERIALVEGALLPGWSLAAWMGQNPPSESDPEESNPELWAVIVHDGARRFVLAVHAVMGLSTIPSDAMDRVDLRSTSALWVRTETHGIIELLQPAEFGGSGPRPSQPKNDVPSGPPAGTIPDPVLHLGNPSFLAAGIGPFTCVFPNEMIGEVLEMIGTERIQSRRHPDACPVIDGEALLEIRSGEHKERRSRDGRGGKKRGLLLTRPSRRPLVLLTSRTALADPSLKWHPLPVAPPALHGFFQSVRLNGDVCELLVRQTRPRSPPLLDRVLSAQAGWLATRL